MTSTESRPDTATTAPESAASPGRVLATLNPDGSRRWLFPRVSSGRFLKWRRVAAYVLIMLFIVLPWINLNGKQSILLDIAAREFTFFGVTFLPTDTLLLMLFLAAVFVAIFLITALLGRLWCGWACPQTVYMEFVYRPIERFFDGNPDARRRGATGATGIRRVAKYITFLLVSIALSHVFLAYFVGVDRLFIWMRQSPFDHPQAFVVMGVTTGLMMFDFCLFREQTCIVCPYGRLQSVLLDRSSLIISYDEQRGEPRGPIRRAKPGSDIALPVVGDCIDCNLCVVTCPTGIDIREGLQLECIGCAQCIDACDSVMDKIKRPRGLVRYSSKDAMERGRARLIRARVIIYPVILLAIFAIFIAVFVGRAPADITFLRGGRTPYQQLASGDVANGMRIKIVNRTAETRRYDFDVSGLDGARIEFDDHPLVVDSGSAATAYVSVVAPSNSFRSGRARVEITVSDDAGFTKTHGYRLQGPWGTAAPSKEGAP